MRTRTYPVTVPASVTEEEVLAAVRAGGIAPIEAVLKLTDFDGDVSLYGSLEEWFDETHHAFAEAVAWLGFAADGGIKDDGNIFAALPDKRDAVRDALPGFLSERSDGVAWRASGSRIVAEADGVSVVFDSRVWRECMSARYADEAVLAESVSGDERVKIVADNRIGRFVVRRAPLG